MARENTAHLSSKNKDTDTDFMRVIAAFFVVVIHVSGITSRAGILYDSIARFSVPLFVIISGYYMLAHPISTGRAFKKAGRLVLLMLLWSGIYLAYELLCGGFEFTSIASLGRIAESADYLFTRPMHLWYMYAAAALYIFTPPLYVFCRSASKSEYIYGLCLSFALGCVLTTALRSGQFPLLSAVVDKSKMPYLLGFIFLYLFGGYVRKYGRPAFAARGVFYVLGILGLAVTFFGTLALAGGGNGGSAAGAFVLRLIRWFGISNTAPIDLLLSFFAPNVVLAAMAFFLAAKGNLRCCRKGRGLMSEISGCTLGIYLLHPLLLNVLQNRIGLFSGLTAITYIPLMSLTVFLLAALLIFLLRHIPILRLLA